jgi:membrane protein implicated in regulation of membrane protease activity
LGRVLALVGTPLGLALVAALVVALAVLAVVWWRRRQRPRGDGGAGREDTHDGGQVDDDVVRPAGDAAVAAEVEGDAVGEGNVAVDADEVP